MTIHGLKDLDHYILREGDIVVFRFKNEHHEFVDLKYVVKCDFLMAIQDVYDISPSVMYNNDAIFIELGLDPHEFCSKYYGYKSNDGRWPHYKDYDFGAVTNVVKALYAMIDSMNMYESAWSHPIVEEYEKQKLKIINYTKELKHKTVRIIKPDNNSKLKRI